MHIGNKPRGNPLWRPQSPGELRVMLYFPLGCTKVHDTSCGVTRTQLHFQEYTQNIYI